MMKKIGKVKDAHGIRGELKVLIFSKDYSWIDDLENFELESPTGKKESFTATKVREATDFLILVVQGIVDRNKAESYRGWSFAVPEEIFISEPGETIYLSEILDFEIIGPEGQRYGLIKSFSSNTFQDLLQVEHAGNLFDIPFVDEFLVSIDFDGKKVIMNLPEGLFDPELVGIKKD